MLLGITGTDGAGKGVVVDYLVTEKGFVHCSARAMFDAECARRGLESTRSNLRLVANALRKEHGNDFLVAYYLKEITEQGIQNAIIESIRAEAEAVTLHREGGVLIAVDADQHIRYDRIVGRGSSTDQISFEEFKAHETMEMADHDPNGMQKAKVIAMADQVIMNDGTLDELYQAIEACLVKLQQQ